VVKLSCGLLGRWLGSMVIGLGVGLGPSMSGAVLVPTESTWRFRRGTAEASSPADAWRATAFVDTAWEQGQAPFYYDRNADYSGNTEVADMDRTYSTLFLRREFTVADPADYASLTLSVLVDDGFSVWINGVLFADFNLASDTAYDALADVAVPEPLQWTVRTQENPGNWLIAGVNVIAVQGFNKSLTSSDFLLELELTGTEPDNSPPVIVGVDPAPGVIQGLQQITVIFSEPVTGVSATDLLANGNPAQGMSGSATVYTFNLEQPPFGDVVIDWDPGTRITDLSVPPNLFDASDAGASWQYQLLDQEPPTVLSVTPFPGVTIVQLTQVEVRFSEPVEGLEADDLLVNGTGATTVTGEAAGPYVFQFASPAAGPARIAWTASHGIRDYANPPNAFAGGFWEVTVDPDYRPPSVVVNEILASTSGEVAMLSDEDGEYQDWIELHNAGNEAVNLAGWSLSDDLDRPGQWVFPAATLQPGAYLVVFASAKDRRAPAVGRRYHTNFKLNAQGEAVALFDASSPRQLVSGFVPEFPEQRSDFSYGLTSEGARYFANPSPGLVNGSSTIEGVVAPVRMNVGRGMFDHPFTLILSTEQSGAQIRYTLDGREPTAATGLLYSGPMTIERTTILRAAAFASGYLPSEVATHTYVFPHQVVQQPANPAGFPSEWIDPNNNSWTADYEMDPEITESATYRDRVVPALRALPILSVVTAPADMFDNAAGIYPKSMNRGPAWERPASAELILPSGETAFQVNCGIQCQGNSARNPQKLPKHAFRLVFKGDYGSSKLHYKVFPDSPVEEFDTLVLRADFNFSWLHWSGTQRPRGQRTRDAFVKDSLRAMGALASHNRYVHLYLNGLYWGIYDPAERPDGAFAASYLGGEKEEYDVVNEGALVDGSMTTYNAMLALNNLVDRTQYEQMQQVLDVDQYIDYILLQFYIGAEDWGRNKNWYTMRRRGSNEGFRYVCWDGENVLGDLNYNRVSNTDTPSELHTKLVANAEYRLRFADHVRRHCFGAGILTSEASRSRWMTRASQVESAIVAESARWGDYRRDVHSWSGGPYELYTVDGHWQAEQNRLMNQYFPARTGVLLNQLRAVGLYPQVAAPDFSLPQGRVARGASLVLSAPQGTIYVTTDGKDPRVIYTGAVEAAAQVYSRPMQVDGTMRVQARVLHNGEWSALTEAIYRVDAPMPRVRITEIHYNPLEGDPYEFLEVQNLESSSVDLGSWSVEGLELVLAPDTWIAPGQVMVFASALSPGAFQGRYAGVTVSGWFDGALANGGERLALLDATGREVTSVDYDDEAGWPVEPDGLGASLEVIDPWGDPDDPANWQASAAPGGSPGVFSSMPSLPALRLNELFAGAAGVDDPTATDFIELYNAGATVADLSGWSLSDSSDPRKFEIPPGTTVGADGYLVIWAALSGTEPGTYGGFGLRLSGEVVALYDASGSRVDVVRFGAQLPDRSLGRIGAEGNWESGALTPGVSNQSLPTGQVTALALNEWLSDSLPGESDWVEIYNRDTELPVALEGIWLGVDERFTEVLQRAFIPAGGHLRFFADESADPGHVDLRLPATGGALVLLDSAAHTVDQVTLGTSGEGVSRGRYPDGAANVVAFPVSASPAASNYLPSAPALRLNEVMAWNEGVVVSEWSQRGDWVEVLNAGTVPVNCDGMGFADSVDMAQRWWFPMGISLPPGEALVVWFDAERPASADATGFLNTGWGLGRRGDGVVFLDNLGQVLDQVCFGPQVRNQTIGRSGLDWALLNTPTPGEANSGPETLGPVLGLRVNEWMAVPASGADWVELWNSESLPVALEGVEVSDDPAWVPVPDFVFPALSFVGPSGFVLLQGGGGAGEAERVPFELASSGESLVLKDPNAQWIDSVFFGPQTTGASSGRFPDGDAAFEVFSTTATPGEPNYLPLLDVVINEALSHTDPPFEDAVELHNVGGASVDVGGWYLSDDPEKPRKYRFASGTWVPAGGLLVVYEQELLNGSGAVTPFTLDSVRGDALLLAEVDPADRLTGRRDMVRFGAAFNGVSFGRTLTSAGVDFVAQSGRSFGVDAPVDVDEFRTGLGLANPGPAMPAVVLSEIHYHPVGAGGEPLADEAQWEYLELVNRTANEVELYDALHPANTWRVAGGVAYAFPQGTTMLAGEAVLLVGWDPVADPTMLADFQSFYGMDPSARVLGPWRGRLANDADRIELLAPDRPQAGPGPEAGFVPYVMIEAVTYSQAVPWPWLADGQEASLQREDYSAYANEPLNWMAGTPTPGLADTSISPRFLTVRVLTADVVEFSWASTVGQSYQVQVLDDLASEGWTDLGQHIEAVGLQTMASDAVSGSVQHRYYRVVQVP